MQEREEERREKRKRETERYKERENVFEPVWRAFYALTTIHRRREKEKSMNTKSIENEYKKGSKAEANGNFGALSLGENVGWTWKHGTMVRNYQESRCGHCTTRSYIRLFACTTHSLAFSALLA